VPAAPPSLTFPLVTSATASNPISYTEETTFGVLKTASPTFSAIAVAQDVTFKKDNIPIDVGQAGSHYLYSTSTGGHNYSLSIPFHPLDLTYSKYFSQTPNYTTPTGTAASSLQFLYKAKRAQGTAQLYDAYTVFLGFRPASMTYSVSAQGLVDATTELMGREVYTSVATNGGYTTPTIPTFASITGPVFQDADSAALPLTIDGVQYTGDNFSITWNLGTFGKSYLGGGGYDEAILVGGIRISGSFTTPIGGGQGLETLANASTQPGVTAKYTIKSGACVINMTKMVITAQDDTILSTPTAPAEDAYTFNASLATIDTS
jgi:hypothetical protein